MTPARKRPAPVTPLQRQLATGAIALLLAAYGAFCLWRGDFEMIRYYDDGQLVRYKLATLHFHGWALWVMSGLMFLVSGLCVALMVKTAQTPPDRKVDRGSIDALAMAAIVVFALMTLLGWLGVVG